LKLEINLGKKRGQQYRGYQYQKEEKKEKKKELKSEINTATVHRPLSLSFECFFMVHEFC